MLKPRVAPNVLTTDRNRGGTDRCSRNARCPLAGHHFHAMHLHHGSAADAAVQEMSASSVIDTALIAFFLAVTPLMLHASSLRGMPLQPKLRMQNAALQFVYRHVLWITVLNGILLALTYVLWRTMARDYWIIVLTAGAPSFLSQLVVLVIAMYLNTSRQ